MVTTGGMGGDHYLFSRYKPGALLHTPTRHKTSGDRKQLWIQNVNSLELGSAVLG